MSIRSPSIPAEGFANIVRWLVHAVVTRGLCGRLATPVIWPILDRIRDINQRFKRLVARLAAGTYRPRRQTVGRQVTRPRPRRPNPLPRGFGWLLKLVPESVGCRSQLEFLLRDPEMTALMAEAPASMARVLRPLCWMLYLELPPVLATHPPEAAPPAPSAKPPSAKPPSAALPSAALPPTPPPPATPPQSTLPAPASPVPARACGPPRSA